MNTTDTKSTLQEFEKLIDQLEADPTSLLAIIKYQNFMSHLPYGTISDDDLNKAYGRISNIKGPNTSSFMYQLLKYMVDQTLAKQKAERSVRKKQSK